MYKVPQAKRWFQEIPTDIPNDPSGLSRIKSTTRADEAKQSVKMIKQPPSADFGTI